MWEIKTFQTKEEMEKFTNSHKITYSRVFINNVPYAIEYKAIKEVK